MHLGVDTGMSRRDYFAAAALVLFDINDGQERGLRGIAKIVYELADEMVKVREEKQP
jgi:hypothetical protein